MKSPEAVLRTALVTNTAVSSLVGAKVFPVQAPVKDHLGNAVKYISRAGKKKDDVEDLKKAVWYLNRKIELMSNHKEEKPCCW